MKNLTLVEMIPFKVHCMYRKGNLTLEEDLTILIEDGAGVPADPERKIEEIMKRDHGADAILCQPLQSPDPQTPRDKLWAFKEKKVMDKLRMEHIDSLPQPLVAHFYSGDEWPLHDIEVETGWLRVNICGKLVAKFIGEVSFFRDIEGIEHNVDTCYRNQEQEKK